MRRSSRSVSANLAEAWHKRHYRQAFIAKLSDSEGEAAETLVWIEYSQRCGYLALSPAAELNAAYNQIVGQLVRMRTRPEPWLLGNR